MRIHGKTPAELKRYCGSLSQFFGVRAATLDDGAERGIRMLEFRTGTGLRFTVAIDRAFDIDTAEFGGTPLSWTSPTGLRHPGLHEFGDENGLGWLRSFSGLLVTGGLDHTLYTSEDSGAHFHYPARDTLRYPLHGRISNIPGRLIGYGASWDDAGCLLWCEGEVAQAAVFGENLHLVRRIEARVGTNEIVIRDRVVNEGYYRTPHMFLYHINLSYPLLDEGSEYVAPVQETVFASHADDLRRQGVGYIHQSGPRPNFLEQVYEHRLVADENGQYHAGLINRNARGGAGLGFVLSVNAYEFPHHFQWQNLQEGAYAIAIEPSTNNVLGRKFAEEQGTLRWLEHGDSYSYTTRLSVLVNRAEIDAFVAKVSALAPTPPPEFAVPSGQWTWDNV